MRGRLAFSVLAIFSTFPLHAQWTQQRSGTNTDLTDIVALDSTRAIAVGRDGSILRTTDAGQTWVILPLAPLFFHPWNAASFSSSVCGSVVGDFGRIATTTDGGDQWIWHTVPGGRKCLSVLEIEPSNIYIGDDSGWVHQSPDTGRTWSSERVSAWPIRSLFAWTGTYTLGLPIYALTPYSLCSRRDFPPSAWSEKILQAFQGLGSEAYRGAFCKGGGAGFIVGVQGDFRAAPAIVRKQVSDTTWKTISTGLSGDGRLFGVSAPSAEAIYVCGDRGMIFHSSDGGDNWSGSSATTTRLLRAISFSDEIRGFAVGDSGTILYTSNGGVTAIREEKNFPPMSPTLFQNYPNPFNPSTTINYELPKSSVVKLSVYDMLGQEVSVLVNERKDAGAHEVKFNASGLSSGVYFYRLQAGSFVQTRKFLRLK